MTGQPQASATISYSSGHRSNPLTRNSRRRNCARVMISAALVGFPAIACSGKLLRVGLGAALNDHSGERAIKSWNSGEEPTLRLLIHASHDQREQMPESGAGQPARLRRQGGAPFDEPFSECRKPRIFPLLEDEQRR